MGHLKTRPEKKKQSASYLSLGIQVENKSISIYMCENIEI